MDSYETIKEYYRNGFPLSDLQKFISECSDASSSYMYRQDEPHISMCFCWDKIRQYSHALRTRFFRS